MERRRRRLGNAEVALAMELRSQGIYWKHIARGLSVDPTSLIRAVTKYTQLGMTPDTPVKPRHIAAVNAKAAAILAQPKRKAA